MCDTCRVIDAIIIFGGDNMFAEKLRKLRIGKGLSQEELGLILGYSRTAVSAYELARNEPSFDDLKKISTYFCVTTDYLLDNDKKIETTQNEQSLTPKQKELLAESSGLTDDDVNKVLEYAQLLKNQRKP